MDEKLTAESLLEEVAALCEPEGIKYFSAAQRLTQEQKGKVVPEWTVYLDGGQHYTGPDPESALRQMREAIAAAKDYLITAIPPEENSGRRATENLARKLFEAKSK